MGCAVSTDGDSGEIQQILSSYGCPPPVIESFQQAFAGHAVPLSVTSEQEVVTGAGLVEVMMEVAESTFDPDLTASTVKQFMQRFIPYHQIGPGSQVQLVTTHGRKVFYEGQANKNVKVMAGVPDSIPDTAASMFVTSRLGRYISFETPPGGAWRGWLLSADQGDGAWVEATEAKYATDDMDACVFECVLPLEDTGDETPFQMPTTNEVLLLTRWGSLLYAPVAPEMAPQTHLMADGTYALSEEKKYEQRERFTIDSRQVRMGAFSQVHFSSLQACHLVAELWEYSKGRMDSHKEYYTS